MRLFLLQVLTCLLTITSLLAQPAIQWDKRFGGNLNDALKVSIQTPDGGYILGGSSDSENSGDKSEPSMGYEVFWIVKIAPDGTKQWDRTLTPGNGVVQLGDLVLTDDGGYIAAGSVGIGAWIVKLDKNGNTEWDNIIRAGMSGQAYGALQKTADGGYILGMSSSQPAAFDKSEDAVNNSFDYWVVKLSANGKKVWDKTIGGTSYDLLTSLQQTADGGYILSGYSASGIGGSKTEANLGNEDYWIVKLDAAGTKIWDKTVGGPGREAPNKIIQARDGGYLLAGQSRPATPGSQLEQSLIKLSATGQTVWSTLLFSENAGGTTSLIRTTDGNYIAGGFRSADAGSDKSENSRGGSDYWLVKVAADGTRLWDKTVGSPDTDLLFSVSQTSDGGYILGGESKGGIGGDKTGDRRGGSDYWIVKLAAESPLPVTLKSFSVMRESTTAHLSWQTSEEIHSDRFEVEHSVNGKSWDRIQSVSAKGESHALQNYQFTHSNPAQGDNYYRLKIVDTDGSSAYSKVGHVKFDSGFDVAFYPNPATEYVHFKVTDWSRVKDVQILDTQGRAHYISGKKPAQEVAVKAFRPGLYIVKMTFTDGTERMQKVAVGH